MTFSKIAFSAVGMGLMLTACGGGGGGGNAPAPTPTPVDTQAPAVSFSPATLTVTSGQTASSTLTATDNVGVTSGPTVTCTNGGAFAGSVFTAPTVTAVTTVTCTATARDARGNSGTGTLTVTVNPPPDTTAPTLSFAPATLSVASGATGASALTVTDNVAVTSGPTVTCTNGGSFAGGVFTAPATAAGVTSVCTATAGDAAGNTGTAELTVTVTGAGPDTTAPVVTFSPDTLTVASDATGNSTLTATDNIGVTSGPTVTCTNGGSFANNVFTAPTSASGTTSVCTATATDAAGNAGQDILTVTVTPPPAKVDISGAVTFDSVPHNTSTNGLDYDNIRQKPIRGATVEAVNGAGTVVASTVSDASGQYTLSVDPNTQVRVRVKAEMVQTSGARWDIKITDNTNNNALYAFQGSLADSGAANSTRNLNAASGWGGSSYTGTRVAGPYAMLDALFDTVKKFEAVDPAANLPAMQVRWSVNNRPVSGTLTSGAIGTSFYSGGNVYMLGAENNDTDEYDTHIMVHEWGHYFEDTVSRSDSIGGSHGGGDRLDPRVALGEGFGNALSGMMLDDPFYRDSNSARQANGFSINVENNNNAPAGWFNEGSVQSILYDVYDSAADGADNVTAGFKPIYDTMVSASYKSNPVFTTIFSFVTELKTQPGINTAGVDAIVSAQSINGTGIEGTGETNNGGIAGALAVYKQLSVNGGPVEICSVNDAGRYNKLGNRNYLTFTANAGSHTLTMTRKSGAANRDPDFIVFKEGRAVAAAEAAPAESETLTVTLRAGQHVIDAYDAQNVGSSGVQGDACYDFTITGP